MKLLLFKELRLKSWNQIRSIFNSLNYVECNIFKGKNKEKLQA